ncbi:protein WHAT'S THIS FACTOR 1 homolog, chloroplastic [Dendrobium catenatum]|uniref:protein WHAT'S THIS FACTOR 1 homolog, chloroplastic n=1 Tax=Dendrobium catenatum TaxID=906689 RepID=UPI0009F4F6E9|nr:protein WHAT'S THIS FACTOR 1 homolog, chloroplastic [Dendrobium catenatum]
MLSLRQYLSSSQLVPKTLNPRIHPIYKRLHRSMGVSSLKVAWRKDATLDAAIERDKRFRLCSRVVREVLNEPGHRIPLRYLEKRRERLRLPFRAKTFLSRFPNLLELYPDRIKPSSPPVPFLRPSPRLLSFLSLQSSIYSHLEPLVLSKVCKLLMMSRHRALPAHKLFSVKRDFGLPDDFLVSLVGRHPHLFRLVGAGGDHLELVSWPEEYARSVIEHRADEESRIIGVRMRPNFAIRLPKGFYLRREMREWTRDWLEIPYISPYEDASRLHPASPEMEKRNVAVFHELLSLSVLRRMAVPVVGKFSEEYRYSNEFANTFTRHPGIFYVSLKGGIKTAMLREAYDEHGELVDRDPFLQIKDKFMEMMEEGHREWMERIRNKREAVQKDLELMARKNAELSVGDYETCTDGRSQQVKSSTDGNNDEWQSEDDVQDLNHLGISNQS